MPAGDPASERKSLLQLATEIAGLFAALAGVLYVTGAAVLIFRLAFKGLPWTNVVSHLPREFMLSIGIGQVFLPALGVGAVYALYRLLRKDRRRAPPSFRLRDGRGARWDVLWRCAVIALLISLPLLTIVATNDEISFDEMGTGLIVVVVGIVLAAAPVATEVRAIVIRRFARLGEWDTLRAAASMAGVYAAIALPATLLGAAAVPLTEAKVCAAKGYSEWGFLVGESSDRVYLGEKPKGPGDEGQRRIAVFPLANVEEIFFGGDAHRASCDFGPPGSSAPPPARSG